MGVEVGTSVVHNAWWIRRRRGTRRSEGKPAVSEVFEPDVLHRKRPLGSILQVRVVRALPEPLSKVIVSHGFRAVLARVTGHRLPCSLPHPEPSCPPTRATAS